MAIGVSEGKNWDTSKETKSSIQISSEETRRGRLRAWRARAWRARRSMRLEMRERDTERFRLMARRLSPEERRARISARGMGRLR
jgi:hypothetical protein